MLVRNIDRIVNIEEAIIHQVKYNMFFKRHIERARMDIYNLGKTEVILGMLWLAMHSPEIDWKKGKVKITRCLPICGKKKQKIERKEVNKIEKEEDLKTLKRLVSKRFWKWKRVFRKRELERMLVQKV